MKLIYIAAPYTTESEFEKKLNIEAARHVGYKIAKEGYYPVMPTVNTAGFDDVGDYQFWIDSTMELMRRCDAVLVVNGSHNSSGVHGEIAEAEKLEMPVFLTIDELLEEEIPSYLEEL